jgi:hypothetical protein
LAGVLALGGTDASAQPAATDSARRPARHWTQVGERDTTRVPYRGLDYGSEATFSPATVMLNKGFDVFEIDGYRRLWSFPAGATWTRVTRQVFTHPGATITRYGGWRRWVRLEILPVDWAKDSANWVPNYLEHLIGGGITMRMLDQWYRERGVPLPRLWAMVTTYAASVANELAEARGDTIADGASTADLLVFDLAAVTLFHWDQPMRFLTQTLEAADWSDQASFSFPNQKLINNGQYISLKIPVGLERWRLFTRLGLSGQSGISWKRNDSDHVSVALGADTYARFVDHTGHETVTFRPSGGIYYDRNNSLLWSVRMSQTENAVTVNVYPGVLPGAVRDFGVWAAATAHRQLSVGVTHRRALGLGMGLGW